MKERTKTIIGVVLLGVFLLMFLAGLNSPEADIVYKKAAELCLECIGIGG